MSVQHRKYSVNSREKVVFHKKPSSNWSYKGKNFTEIPGKWYNLLSGRYVKNKPVKCDYSIRGIKIIGTEDCINKFIDENKTQLKDHKPKVFKPYEDIRFITDDAVERSRMCLTNLMSFVENEITLEDLTKKQINEIVYFGFENMFLQAKVVNVVDGDTIDIVVLIPVNKMCRARTIGKKDENMSATIFRKGSEKTSFFTKLRLRLWGYDAAEKDTEAGKLATKLLIKKFKTLNNIIWVQLLEKNVCGSLGEKYGRVLSVMYEDEERTKPLNDYLVRMEKKHKTKMVHPYFGGKKKEF